MYMHMYMYTYKAWWHWLFRSILACYQLINIWLWSVHVCYDIIAEHNIVYHGMVQNMFSSAMAKSEAWWDFEYTKGKPYFTLTGRALSMG